MALNKSLKNLHDYRCEGHWTIVIQARGFIVLRHRDDDGFFKGGGNYRGSKGLVEDRSLHDVSLSSGTTAENCAFLQYQIDVAVVRRKNVINFFF